MYKNLIVLTLAAFFILTFGTLAIAAPDLSKLGISKQKVAVIVDSHPKIQANESANLTISQTVQSKFESKFEIVEGSKIRNQWIIFMEKQGIASAKSTKQTQLQTFAKENGFNYVLLISMDLIDSAKDKRPFSSKWIVNITADVKMVDQESAEYYYFDSIAEQGVISSPMVYVSEKDAIKVAVEQAMKKVDAGLKAPAL